MNASRRGLVAVLFTDLVGSTELMSQLGDRAFDDLRRRHFARRPSWANTVQARVVKGPVAGRSAGTERRRRS